MLSGQIHVGPYDSGGAMYTADRTVDWELGIQSHYRRGHPLSAHADYLVYAGDMAAEARTICCFSVGNLVRSSLVTRVAKD